MKNIISTLLVMVIILTMTACSNSDAETLDTTTIEASIVETTCETTDTEPAVETLPEYELKVDYLSESEIDEMGAEKLSAFLSDMVHISETETLSANEMNIIGTNFYYIWETQNSTYNQDEFNQKTYKVFCNIYDQALQYRIPLDELYCWTFLPVPDVLSKYFSSTNFDKPERAYCDSFHFLDSEDVTRVAEVFFANPLMDTNTGIPCILILLDCNTSTTDAAWRHFEELSKNASPKTTLSNEGLTAQICDSLLFTGMDSKNMNKIADISEIILENPYYDFNIKYMYFCNAFYDYDKEIYSDDTISSRAIDSLFNLAENADENTLKLLKELIEFLNYNLADKLSCILDENNPTA